MALSVPLTFSLLASALFIAPVLARVHQHSSQLPVNKYDYIVVGAGAAGLGTSLLLASRRMVLAPSLFLRPALGIFDTAPSSLSILMTFFSDEGILAAQVPLLAPTLTPNYMSHHYGSSEDYDRLARITGDSGWSWNNMKQYIKRHEKIVPPADGHNTTGQYTPSLHGTNGVLPKSLPGYSVATDSRIIATTRELSSEFPFNQDITSGNVLGVTWVQSAIGGGKRSSSSTTYLASVKDRKNVDVLVNAQVTKLLRTGTVGGKPSFKGVQYAAAPGSPTQTAYAREEVILSAGSLGTPQILMLSGIGDKDELASHYITTVIENTSVGKNLSDHALLPNNWIVQGTESLDGLFRDQSALNSALVQWQANKTGPLVHGTVNHIGFFRLPSDAPIFETTSDPSSGPTASHYELIFSSYWLHPTLPSPANGSYMTICSALISPTSRGYLKLASADPFQTPLINPQYLSTAFDKYTLREAVKAAKRFTSGPAWADYILAPYGDLASTNTDADIDAYARKYTSTIFHPVGTAAMSAKDAGWGVVDPDFRLKGADGVRIVDASVWPFVPNAHTQGPVYLLAERAASIIAEPSKSNADLRGNLGFLNPRSR
ncbi:hypothetical protein D9611_002938 [Ephemerocybe angulata]|uniref:pyranose dehydrogenase (acceptor) n=1 Tax=Ephemerocybe angulata TaxID=980116 RepID=A0A8H5C9V8_9AGAR|nr:hypothetical protein D9611_002938 [Tulosesus angulatus]